MVWTPGPTSFSGGGGYASGLGDWSPPLPSFALTPPNTFGTAARQLVPALAPLGAGQLARKSVASGTRVDLGGRRILENTSVAVTVIVWTPGPTSVPAAGD